MRSVLFLLTMTLAAAPLAAAEPTADDYLNFYKPTIGEWNVKYQCGEKTAEGTRSCSLSDGRSIISAGTAILQYPAFHALGGYDPESKAWKWSVFDTTGAHGTARWSADADALKSGKATFRFEWQVTKADGAKEVWRGDAIVTTGQDQWSEVFTHQTLNGQPHPDEQYTYQRRDPPAAQAGKLTPGQEHMEALAFLIGEWEDTDQTGKKVKTTCEWMCNRSYILTTQGEYREIIGWDLQHQRIVSWGFGTHGGQGMFVWTPTDGGWEVRSDPVFLDRWGKPFKANSRITVTDPDTLQIELTFGAQNSRITSKRKKPAEAKLDDLAWLIGPWQGEYVMPDGLSELGPAGAKVVTSNVWQRALDGKFMTLSIREEINGKVISTGEEYAGQDPRSGALSHWFFSSLGGQGTGQWRRNGQAWELAWVGFVSTGGKRYEGVTEYLPIDADTHTVQIRHITEDGKPIPDWPKVTYRRIK